jgi:DNA-binding NarL/FixJ family response regulator
LIVEGLKMVLAKKGIQVIGEATTGRQAVEKTLALGLTLLLDIRMPDMDGLEALASITATRPRTSAWSWPPSESRIPCTGVDAGRGRLPIEVVRA